MRPDKGVVRLVRAAALVSVVLGLATAAHALAGGELPRWQSLLVLGAALGPFALIGTTVRLRRGWLVAALAAGQVVGHVGLTALADGPSCVVPPGHAGHAAALADCAHGAAALGAVGVGPAGVGPAGVVSAGHAGHLAASPSLLMLLAHAVATLLTAWLLSRGEDLLWRTVRWLLPSPRRRRVVLLPRPTAVATTSLWVPHVAVLLSVQAGRAPPAVVGS